MLEVKDVTRRFSSGRGQIAALDSISFSVRSGQNIVLAGKSGSGKTTLLNCLGTLELPDSGAVVFNGNVVSRLTSARRTHFRRTAIGFVFQDRNLLPWLTVAENIAFPLVMNNISKQKRDRRIAELLTTFGLTGYEKALPAELSGGESQRIAFARAVAHSPAILLADEPTASLDTANGTQLVKFMLSLCLEQGIILVIATHDRDLLRMAERVIYLKDGRMEGSNEKNL